MGCLKNKKKGSPCVMHSRLDKCTSVQYDQTYQTYTFGTFTAVPLDTLMLEQL